VTSDRRNADRPFVPPRVLALKTPPKDDDSEEETQLLKEQPVWTDQTEGKCRNFNQKEASENEDKTSVAVRLDRQKDKIKTKRAKTVTSSDDVDDGEPVIVLLQRPKQSTAQTPSKTLRTIEARLLWVRVRK
jgi:hypothetical protein